MHMRIATAFALGLAVLAPAQACEPEAMNAELSRVCDGALVPARERISALRGHASGPEQRAIDAALARAQAACDTGDPVLGAAEAVNLARLAGRIEARIGDATPIWHAELALATPR